MFENVPENLVDLNFVPNVPDSLYKLGTKSAPLIISNFSSLLEFYWISINFEHRCPTRESKLCLDKKIIALAPSTQWSRKDSFILLLVGNRLRYLSKITRIG